MIISKPALFRLPRFSRYDIILSKIRTRGLTNPCFLSSFVANFRGGEKNGGIFLWQ